MEITTQTQTDLDLDIFDSIDFEKIVDHPNILIAAHFWDKERYQVHIIRDFQKDHLNNLNYFPDDLIAKYSMDRQQLLFMAKGGQITDGFRSLIRDLYEVADFYRLKTYEMIQEIRPFVEPRGQLSLEIIFALYLIGF